MYIYYYYRIFGSDSNWNITKMSLTNLAAHSGNLVSPKKQPQEYMTLVTYDLPTQ
ncbi:MAG: hypothetical protein Q4B40_06285 [Clostridia bacterium]|nr:hypothetical protein [Clostridia bacterium]